MTVEVPKELTEQIYKLIESVKVDGKLRKGTNETTKAIEKNEAQLVVSAEDINPKEIIMHLPSLCEERGIPYVEVPSKSELGAAAGLPVSTSSIAIVNPGDAKKLLLDVLKSLENLSKAEAKGEKKAEAPVEEVQEEKKEAKPAEKKAEEPKGKLKKEKPEAKPVEELETEEQSEDLEESNQQEEAPVEEKAEESTPEEAPAEEEAKQEPVEEEAKSDEQTEQEEKPVEEVPAEEEKE